MPADEDFEFECSGRALPKSTWTEEEDAQLASVVRANGAKNWSVISSFVPGRTGKQCRERYKNHLDPSLRKGPFTAHEDKVIVWLVEREGAKWALIARKLVGRTDNAIKNRYNSSLRRAHEEKRFTVSHDEFEESLSKVQSQRDSPPPPRPTPRAVSPGRYIPTTPPGARSSRPQRRAKQRSMKRLREEETSGEEDEWSDMSESSPKKRGLVESSPPSPAFQPVRQGRERSQTQELVFSAALALVEMKDID